MGKTMKWFKKLFTRNKDKDKEKKPSIPPYSFTESKIFTRSASLRAPPPPPDPESPKLKRGGSFRITSPSRVPAAVKPVDHDVAVESWIEQKKVVAAAVASAKAKLAGAVAYRRSRVVEEAAAVTIQAVFRSYLARKALKALVGVVKLQALVRGYLVRKETSAALKCMQSLAMAEARARTERLEAIAEARAITERLEMADDQLNSSYRKQHNHRKSEDWRSRQASYDQEIDWGMDENIRILKMDARESKRSPKVKSFSGHPPTAQAHARPSKGSATNRAYSKQENRDSPTKPSALASPGSRSKRFDNHYFDTAQSIPEYSEYSGTDSMSEYSDYPKSYQRVFTNCAYSMQERQDFPLPSGPRAESARFDDYSLDNNTQSSSDASSYTTSVPEYPFYEQNTVAPAYVENTQPSGGPKLVRSRSAPRTGADSLAGLWAGKKFQPSSPQVGPGMGPEWNVDSWSAKRTSVGGSGKKRNYGSSPSPTIRSSPTSRRSTVNGNLAVQGNRY